MVAGRSSRPHHEEHGQDQEATVNQHRQHVLMYLPVASRPSRPAVWLVMWLDLSTAQLVGRRSFRLREAP